MKPMYYKPVQFDCKRDNTRGCKKRLGFKNWWETEICTIKTKSSARQVEKKIIQNESIYINGMGI